MILLNFFAEQRFRPLMVSRKGLAESKFEANEINSLAVYHLRKVPRSCTAGKASSEEQPIWSSMLRGSDSDLEASIATDII
jgi:hypothetical protein